MEKTPEPRSGVSYIMPIYNEVDYVEAAVTSILARTTTGPSRSCWRSRPSTDGTDDVVHRLAAATSGSRSVDNPGHAHPDRPQPCRSRSPAIRSSIRVDAHTQLEPGYTDRGVAELHAGEGRQPRRHHGRRSGRPGSRRRSPAPTTAGSVSAARRTTPGTRSPDPPSRRISASCGPRRVARHRRLRRVAAARRGLGDELPPPQGRPPGVARPGPAGHLLAA